MKKENVRLSQPVFTVERQPGEQGVCDPSLTTELTIKTHFCWPASVIIVLKLT